jgi:hypothetical protein
MRSSSFKEIEFGNQSVNEQDPFVLCLIFSSKPTKASPSRLIAEISIIRGVIDKKKCIDTFEETNLNHYNYETMLRDWNEHNRDEHEPGLELSWTDLLQGVW